jgi:hypothetical protein
MCKLDFLLLASLQGVFFNPHRPEGLKIFHPSTTGLTLEIKPNKPDEDGSGLHHGLMCRAQLLGVTVPADEWSFIDALINRRFQPYPSMPIELPLVAYGKEQISAAGIIRKGFGFPFELCPPAVQALAKRVAADMSAEAVKVIKLLRWQQNIDGPHWPFSDHPPLYWRTSEGPFHIVPLESRGGKGRSPAGITWREEDEREFLSLWSSTDVSEPLGHELLREASELASTSPRSAILAASSAVEVGTKLHIARLAPDTEWLVSEMPSPPVHKMLRTYLPALHLSKGTTLDFWPKLKPLFNRIEDLGNRRNKLTHIGAMPLGVSEVYVFLEAVSDVLYILDVLDGHEWAKEHVSAETRAKIGWQGRKRPARLIVELLPSWPPPR